MATLNVKLARAVRTSAIYDLVTCLPLALPGVAGVYLSVLDTVNGAIGLGGAVGELSPLAMMFINFLGSLISIWAVLRLINPSWANGLTDVAVRTLFSIAMLNAIMNGVPGLVGVLWVCELGLLLVQAYYLHRVWQVEHRAAVAATPAPGFGAHAPAE
ncbi:hypothetical protein GCM10011321_15130 [Youhaiella tibetensis]|uniref:Uncharacterized protein n=1 Tax=Paradevosia tibetensis TaxID=1447062 RepID=A0A5B9DM18_9HYPH|nr:hypothetical protein [Youhaiella tibetensis]AKR55301.1 hypothetical protein XM25_05660 [Devosia sp. H5989]QEE20381.1 hypothetical protein FNA67_09425 [Youhaiella tibetensis]GGF24688.1 hypothetical protein GCM10011321_15130 [Youhaiella tibetensis]